MSTNANSNVPVVAGNGNAAVPQNITSGLSLAGASNGTNLALASAAAAEVLGQMQVAKAFPRDEIASLKRITNSCQRPELANISSYTYSKGGTEVTGASIHLLKAIAAKWGNVKSGYVIVESSQFQTKCEAYATDLETNYTARVPFVVRHIRHTRSGDYPLTDDREIYELVANNASRRERKCLEAVIPADVVQTALDECRKTMTASCGEITEERVNEMVGAYSKFGVSKAALEAFVQRPLVSVAPAQWVRLQTIFKSLRDGVAKKEDFFREDPDAAVVAESASAPSKCGKGKKGGKSVEEFLKEHPAKIPVEEIPEAEAPAEGVGGADVMNLI